MKKTLTDNAADGIQAPAGGETPLYPGNPAPPHSPKVIGVKIAMAVPVAVAASLLVLVRDSHAVFALGVVLVLALLVADLWLYRVLDRAAGRPSTANTQETKTPETKAEDIAEATDVAGAAVTAGDPDTDRLFDRVEELMSGVLDRLTNPDASDVETMSTDLYRLHGFNNQLIRLGEIAQEMNTALPFRETKAKALELSRQLLSADIVALVSEEGTEFRLEAVDGCEEAEIKVDCCSYYSRCPIRASFRNSRIARTSDHKCSMFAPTMNSQLSLPFTLDDGRTLALIAVGARPDAFDDLNPPVLAALVGHIQTSLTNAHKFDRIRREVVTDPLTNLYNRRFFQTRAEEEIARSLRHQSSTSLLMLDVDHFKEVNDTYGHQTGDKVLQVLAGHLQDHVRKSDICGRYGGDEFLLILPDTPGRNAVLLADRLRSGFADMIHTGLGIPSSVSVTISGGVATCPRDATSVSDLISAADRALYEAKRAGRNRVVQAGITTTSPESPGGHENAGTHGPPAQSTASPS